MHTTRRNGDRGLSALCNDRYSIIRASCGLLALASSDRALERSVSLHYTGVIVFKHRHAREQGKPHGKSMSAFSAWRWSDWVVFAAHRSVVSCTP